ncbi:MAG: Ycf66 family protein [Cyanobacteriota bacterium]|nr:Ycf66 family protein [Cyanobacteriota bacterium]
MFLTTSPYFLMAALTALASGGIFAIRYIKPEAAREYDVIFATMGLIYAGCLLLEGQRLIPLLFFAQVLLAVMAGWFALETFRLRLQLMEKSKQVVGKGGRREGFNRTYRPNEYESGRTVSTRRGDARMRDGAGSRTIASRDNGDPRHPPARRRPPQLTADTTVAPRRSPKPAPLEDDIDTYEGEEYDRWEDRDNSPPPPSERRPAGSRPRPPADDNFGEEDAPRSERSDSPAAGSRRRPPRLPDQGEPENRPPRRVIQVEPVIEDNDEDDV